MRGYVLRVLGGAGALSCLFVAPALAEAVTPLDTVTSTATKTEKSTIDVLGSVSTVDQEQIEHRIPSSVDDILQGLPNVEVDGGPRKSAEQINIRGFDSERIVIRTDGARQNFQAGHRGRMFLDPDMVKQVDVVRGPNSMIYGSGALGGVVSFTTKDAFDFLEGDETYGARTRFGYQDVNKEWMKGGSLFGRVGDQFGGLLSYTSRISGNVRAGDPSPADADQREEVPFSKDDIHDGLANFIYRPAKNHQLGFTAEVFNDRNNVPTEADGDTTSLIADRNTRQTRFVLGYNFASEDTPLVDATARVYRNETSINEKVVSLGTSLGRDDDTTLLTNGLDVYNTSRFMTYHYIGHALTYGVEFYRDSQSGTRNGAARAQFPDATSDVVGFYVQDEMTIFKDFTLMPGVRYDRFSLDPDNASGRADGSVSPKIAAGYRPFDWVQVYGLYSEAFRAPSLTELYATGVHFPLFGPFNNVFLPNPDLKPEKAKNLEGGFSLKFDDVLLERDHIRAKTSFFRTNVDNFIDLKVINEFPAGPFTTQAVNIRDARLTGFEGVLYYETSWVFGGVSYSQVRGMDLTEGDSLGSIPADKYVLDLGTRVPDFDLVLGYRAQFVQDQYRVPADGSRQQTDGYTLHDVYVSWVPTQKLLKGLRLDFGVDNLADTRYRRHLANLPDPGRNVKFALSYTHAF
ncbi:MAG: TonB-dependent hemoglobin/transferrin/lactoferrin family receptor [Candidatus Eiseniibacteriota bacterium]